MTVEVVECLNKILESILFRIIALLIGLALCVFYGILILAAFLNIPDSWSAFANLPDAWFYLLYCLGGITSGMLCFIYVDNPKRRKFFFVIIVPFLICMIVTFLSKS
jgi:hypothetical protein